MSDRLKGDHHLGQAGLFKRTTYEDAGQMLAVIGFHVHPQVRGHTEDAFELQCRVRSHSGFGL